MDVPPSPSSSSFEVTDLLVGTRYTFAIMAYNEVGQSKYTDDIGWVETGSESVWSDRVVGKMFNNGAGTEGDLKITSPSKYNYSVTYL